MMAETAQSSPVRRAMAVVGGLGTLLLGLMLTGCPPVQPPAVSATRPAGTVEVALTTARRQSNFVPLASLGLPAGAAQVQIGPATGPAAWSARACRPLLVRRQAGSVTSPAADQLLGTATAQVDGGSVLVPVAVQDTAAGRTFAVDDPNNIMLQLDVAPTVPAGLYTFPIRVTPGHMAVLPAPVASAPATTRAATGPAGTAAGTQRAAVPVVIPAGGTVLVQLQVSVSDLALPAEPAMLTLATTSAAELAALYPATFGQIQGAYLDRGDPDHKAAVEQLDALVVAAQRQGIALFMEDLGPSVKIDEVGRVVLDWDAYDRTVFAYMDGSAFADHVGLPVWLAPVPPRRVRETPTQLRQYWQGCIEHFREKNWNAVPVLMHPALLAGEGPLVKPVSEVLNFGVDKSAAVAGTPDLRVVQPKMWVVDDADRRLPPAGELATAQSVRVWPWMGHARGLKGMVWRHAVGEEARSKRQEASSGAMPLWVVGADGVRETVRLAWLKAGMNDAEHFGLLAKRSDPTLAAEVLAGIVGRTGLAASAPMAADEPQLAPPGGYLYAAWPESVGAWQALPAMIDQLIAVHAPGQAVQVRPDDPLYLKTRMWLAQAHRPVARVSGYRFGLEPSRDGTVLSLGVELQVENPVGVETPLDVRWPNLPGDLQLQGANKLALAPHGLVRHSVQLAGHLDLLGQQTGPLHMQLTERRGGAVLDLPVLLPIERAKPTREAPKIDGRGGDWPVESARIVTAGTFGPVAVTTRYLARPDLLAGTLRQDASGARVRFTYDSDWLYALIECPQAKMDDDRTSDWPAQDRRWWGTDGVQVQLAGGAKLEAGTRIVQLAIKPSGTVLTRSATLAAGRAPAWTDGPTGLRYGITSDHHGYTVELAMPRRWFTSSHDKDPNVPVWRVNVLRYQDAAHLSTSWTGPVVDDLDMGMMGALIGGAE